MNELPHIIDGPTPEQFARDLAQRLYGLTPTVHKFWSEVNHVCLLDFGDALAPKVLKFAKDVEGEEIVREQRVLHALGHLGVAVPSVEFTQADWADAPMPFTVMPRIGLKTLGELYHHAADDKRPVELFFHAGELLARIHRLSWQEVSGSASATWADARDARYLASLSERVEQLAPAPEAQRVLAQAGELVGQKRTGFVHRDFHSGNALVTPERSLCLIDWGHAGAGLPLLDLGRCLAVTQTWFGLAEVILAGYRSVIPLDDASMEEVNVWRECSVLEFMATCGRDVADRVRRIMGREFDSDTWK